MQRVSSAMQRWRIYAQDLHANGQAAMQTLCQTADCCARALDAVRFIIVQNTQLTFFAPVNPFLCTMQSCYNFVLCSVGPLGERQMARKRLADHQVRVFWQSLCSGPLHVHQVLL